MNDTVKKSVNEDVLEKRAEVSAGDKWGKHCLIITSALLYIGSDDVSVYKGKIKIATLILWILLENESFMLLNKIIIGLKIGKLKNFVVELNE